MMNELNLILSVFIVWELYLLIDRVSTCIDELCTCKD